jgi:hypothetical protein
MDGSTESGGRCVLEVDHGVAHAADRVVTRDGWRAWLDVRRRAQVGRVALLVGCLGIVAWYVSLALRVDGNNDNDAAYYLGVARYMARTGRFQENIVWHFLGHPTSVIHAPFTYWQGLTSLVLVPVLVAFRGPHAPFVFMALVSGCMLILLWHLVTQAAPLKHPIAQAVTLLAVGLSPAMTTYRVDTDTVSLTQLWIVASLVALAAGRLKTATCIAFLTVLTRGDGAVLCAFMWGACLWAARTATPSPIRTTAQLLFTFGTLGAAYATASLLLHGRVPSQATWQAPRLTNYLDLYAFGPTPNLVSWVQRCRWKGVGEAFWTAVGNLRSTPFAPAHDIWMAVVLLVGWRSVRWRLQGVVWALLFLGSTAIVFLSGPMFSPWRTLYTMLPLAALAGGALLDAALDRLSHVAAIALGRLPGAAVAELAGVGLLLAWVSGSKPLPRPTHQLATWDTNLKTLDPELHGETVASARPWSVIANTESPAVMIPCNGPDAVEQALKLFHVRWLLLSNEPCVGITEETCAKIRAGTQRELGTLALTERPAPGDLRLFRITERDSDPH